MGLHKRRHANANTLHRIPSPYTQSLMSELREQYTQTLFERDSKGFVKTWGIEVVPYAADSEFAIIRTTYGRLDGKHQVDDTRVVIGKNIGKANETSPWEQAIAEAKGKTERQVKKGYVDSVDNLRAVGELGSGTKEPMLAEKFDPTGKKKKSKTLAQLRLEGVAIIVQPKKDGNRANPAFDSEGKLGGYLSRKGNPYPYHFPKITTVLEAAYQSHPELKGQSVTLDGELFTTELSFNELNGILKKKTLSQEYIDLLDTVEFHLYDIYSEEHYQRRIELYKPFGQPQPEVGQPDTRCVKAIDSFVVEASNEVLKEYLDKFLNAGEEGLIIRTLNQPYIYKRCWHLLKYTLEETADFRIIGMELNKKERLDKFVLEAPQGCFDRKGNPITEFKVGSQMSRAELADILKNKSDYLGEIGVVKFKGLSEFGVPRCGKFHGLRADYTGDTEEDNDD